MSTNDSNARSAILARLKAFNAEMNAVHLLVNTTKEERDTVKGFFHKAKRVREALEAEQRETEALKRMLVNGTDKEKSEAMAHVVEENITDILACVSEAEVKVSDDAAKKLIDRIAAASPKLSFSDLVAANKAKSEQRELDAMAPHQAEAPAEKSLSVGTTVSADGKQESFSLDIVLNEKQIAASNIAFAGKDFVLTGAAGTGKTTTQRAVAASLYKQGKFDQTSFKSYTKEGKKAYVTAPSIAFCAFTRRAASNLAKALFKDETLAAQFGNNVMTIHTLLEYEPVTYDEFDVLTGETKQKFRFEPQKTAENPLTITHLIIEESSMIDAAGLWGKLYDALPSDVQIIFIGDLNQLPPVFGASILNYAVSQLPVVELTEVYRNQGIVLENAHNILNGRELVESDKFQIVRGKSQVQVGPEKTAYQLGREDGIFHKLYHTMDESGQRAYDPATDIILSPWNKHALGTNNMNNWIAQFIGAERKAIVYEVIAGIRKLYLAEGDRVMVNRRDGYIKEIKINSDYHGKEPQMQGSDLTRFGTRIIGGGADDSFEDLETDYTNFSLEALEESAGERKQQSSHSIVVHMDDDTEEELTAAGDFSEQSFSLGYCLTVHKAQGSEWRKVYIIMHKSHATTLYRELFYTAVTRARVEVVIISKDHVIRNAIKSQRIKGNTLADKIAYFNQGIENDSGIYASKRLS